VRVRARALSRQGGNTEQKPSREGLLSPGENQRGEERKAEKVSRAGRERERELRG
jgi:hypothetical protein